MKAMSLSAPADIQSSPLKLVDVPIPEPSVGEALVKVDVCGVCRTDLHVVEGDLTPQKTGIIPGHEVVGQVVRTNSEDPRFEQGQRVGVAWLHETCGKCSYCMRGDENLCDKPRFTGYDANGGYAEYIVAPEDFMYPIPNGVSSVQAAPFLCAGIIGYRALIRSGIKPGEPIGLYGFGGSAHIVIQIAHHWGCPVYVATRGGKHLELARELGAVWTGPAHATPSIKLRAAILFAPVGHLVLPAMAALDKGGTLAIAGIHLSPIPVMDYQEFLFQERSLRSVTANTRRDGEELMRLAAEVPLHSHTVEYPLEAANEALRDLKNDGIQGTAVLRVS